MEKLSELSKPVMYSIACNGAVEEIGGDSQGFSREEVQAELDSWGDVVHGVYSVCALYSQEYASALLAELEAKDKRIAELEASETQLIQERDSAEQALADMYEAATGERPEWSNWFVFADAVEEVAQVRAKLATPVRLPRPACTYADHSYPAYSRKQVEGIITSAGMRFTVEGDE